MYKQSAIFFIVLNALGVAQANRSDPLDAFTQRMGWQAARIVVNNLLHEADVIAFLNQNGNPISRSRFQTAIESLNEEGSEPNRLNMETTDFLREFLSGYEDLRNHLEFPQDLEMRVEALRALLWLDGTMHRMLLLPEQVRSSPLIERETREVVVVDNVVQQRRRNHQADEEYRRRRPNMGDAYGLWMQEQARIGAQVKNRKNSAPYTARGRHKLFLDCKKVPHTH